MMSKAIKLLNLGECAAMLHLTPDTVRRYVKRGMLPAYEVGKQLRFDESEVLLALRKEAGPMGSGR